MCNMRIQYALVAITILATTGFLAGCQKPTDQGTQTTQGSESLPATVAFADIPKSFQTHMVVLKETIHNERQSGETGDMQALELLKFSDGKIVQQDGKDVYAVYVLDKTNFQQLAQGAEAIDKIHFKLSYFPVSDVETLMPLPGDYVNTIRSQAKTLFPAFKQAKEKAIVTSQKSQLKQIAVGALIYMTDYDDVVPAAPDTATLAAITLPYLKNIELWKSRHPDGGQFEFNVGIAGIKATEEKDAKNTVMLYETKAWPDGLRAVAFLDGHVDRIDEKHWATLKESMTKRLARNPKPKTVSPQSFPTAASAN